MRSRGVRTHRAALGRFIVATAFAFSYGPVHPSTLGIDVRIVVDVSLDGGDEGSLDVAATTISFLADRLPAGSNGGVWAFGGTTVALVPYRPVDGGWRTSARSAAAKLGGIEGSSPLHRVIEEAAWDADVGVDANRKLILVTRGGTAPADDAERRLAITELLPRLQRAGIQVYVLMLSRAADLMWLRQLAQATGGNADLVESRERANAFLEEVVGGGATLAGPRDGSFIVAAGQQEITVVARGGDIEARKLRTPADQILDAYVVSSFVRWFDQDGRTLISLAGPAPGRWRIEPTPGELRTFEGLTLHLRPETSEDRVTGVVAILTQRGVMIDDPLLTGLVNVEATLAGEDGSTQLRVHPPGGAAQSYRVDLSNVDFAPDDRIRVRAIAPTFEREAEFTFSSSAPLRLVAQPGGGGEAVIEVQIAAPGLIANSLRVTGAMRYPNGRAKVVAGLPLTQGTWQVRAPPLGREAEVVVRINGNYLDNKEFESQTKPWKLELPLAEPLSAEFNLTGERYGDAVAEVATTLEPLAGKVEPEVPEEDALAGASQDEIDSEASDETEGSALEAPPDLRKLSMWDAIGAGTLLGLNLLALIAFVIRRFFTAPTPEEGTPVASRVEAACTQYREVLAQAAKQLGIAFS